MFVAPTDCHEVKVVSRVASATKNCININIIRAGTGNGDLSSGVCQRQWILNETSISPPQVMGI